MKWVLSTFYARAIFWSHSAPKNRCQIESKQKFQFFFHSAFDWVIASPLALGTLRRGFYSPCPLPWLPIDFEHLEDIVGVLARPPKALRLEKHNVREPARGGESRGTKEKKEERGVA